MTRKTLFLTGILFVLTLFFVACGGNEQQTSSGAAPVKNDDGYTDIDAQELAAMLQAKDFYLVNVHIPFASDIPHTNVSIPYDQIEQNLDQLPGKDDSIVLYCSSGSMSTVAAKTLTKLGYTNVMELDGGFSAWADAGNALLER